MESIRRGPHITPATFGGQGGSSLASAARICRSSLHAAIAAVFLTR
jgi:hypothetical protein